MKEKDPNLFELIYFVYKSYYSKSKFKWHVFALGVFRFLIEVYPILYSYLFAKLIDKAIFIAGNAGNIQDISTEFIYFAIALVGQTLVNNGYDLVDLLLNLWMPYIEDEVFINRYIEIEPQAYEDTEFVNAKNTLGWNAWNVHDSLYSSLEIVASLITAVISFFVIYQYSLLFAILAFFAVIPTGFITIKYGRKVWNIWGGNGEEKTKYASYRNHLWTGNFESFQEIYLFGYGKYLFQRAKEINEKFTKKLEKNDLNRQASLTISSIWRQLLFLTVVIYSIYMVINGNLTIGLLTFVIAAYKNFNDNISTVVTKSASVVSNKNFLKLFYKTMMRKNKIESGDVKLCCDKEGLDIEFRNVWFKYPNTKKWILRDVSFKINPDEDVAIVGKNGAGKTTIIKILLRIYDINKGEILINGTNIKDLDIQSYYRVVGVLSQSFNKLGITAKDNIHVGDITKNNYYDVYSSAKLADVDQTIRDLPEGYNTYLTRDVNNGVQLSGGQWQKLAIARAFYRNTKLLILDEPTSAVDAISEEKIFDNILANAVNQTTLIISHRFSTVKKAKKILVIDEGRVTEQGEHEQLMKLKGLYYTMYSKQAGTN